MSGPTRKSGSSRRNTLAAYRVVMIYLVVSVLWIFGSDSIVNLFTNDKDLILQLSVIKGTGFVFATAILLYYLVRMELDKALELEQKDRLIQRKEDILKTLSDNIPKGFTILVDPQGKPMEIKSLRPEEREVPDRSGLVRHIASEGGSGIGPLIESAGKGVPWRMELELDDGYYLVHGIPVRDDEDMVFSVLVISENITEIKRSEQALALKVRQLAVLFDVSKAMLDYNTVEEMMPEACRIAVEGFGLDGIWIGKKDPKGEKVIDVSGWGEVIGDAAERTSVIERAGSIGPEQKAIEGRRVVQVDDVRSVNDDWAEEIGRKGIRAAASFPLLQGDEVFGSLNIYSREPGAFTPAFIESLLPLANVISLGLQKIRFIGEINEQKNDLELRVMERTEDLQEANAYLDSFAFSVSHDLQAPVRGMKGLAEAMLEDFGTSIPEKGKEYLKLIMNDSVLLESTIQDMLSYSRVTRMDLSIVPIDLRSAVEQATAVVKPEVGSTKATIDLDIPEVMVLASHGVLRHVMVNLLTNALKYTRKGQRPEVRVEGRTMGGTVRISVIDKGIGISPDEQGKLFKLFSRLHSQEDYPGSGIGLAIFAKGVERMGGTYGLISEEGKGSEFWFELPLAKEGPTSQAHDR
ncbi:MAG: GAF domain-containing sensor histidine kinase [Euryarchaeota archaeon]|nr:GAF domain-containing sensor histidine kinase [Euryarchaeota archaeon]